MYSALSQNDFQQFTGLGTTAFVGDSPTGPVSRAQRCFQVRPGLFITLLALQEITIE